MTAPTREEFLVTFPELAIHPEAVLDGVIAQATRLCSESVWGSIHGDGVSYLAAHMISLRTRQVGASIDQGTKDPNGAGTASTFYGQHYEALRSTLPLTGFVV